MGPAWLKNIRLQAGLSQGALAERLGMTRTHVSRIESGERETPLSNVEKWAAVCGFRLEALPLDADRAPIAAAPTAPAAPTETDAMQAFFELMQQWPRLSATERTLTVAQLRLYAHTFKS